MGCVVAKETPADDHHSQPANSCDAVAANASAGDIGAVETAVSAEQDRSGAESAEPLVALVDHAETSQSRRDHRRENRVATSAVSAGRQRTENQERPPRAPARPGPASSPATPFALPTTFATAQVLSPGALSAVPGASAAQEATVSAWLSDLAPAASEIASDCFDTDVFGPCAID